VRAAADNKIRDASAEALAKVLESNRTLIKLDLYGALFRCRNFQTCVFCDILLCSTTVRSQTHVADRSIHVPVYGPIDAALARNVAVRDCVRVGPVELYNPKSAEESSDFRISQAACKHGADDPELGAERKRRAVAAADTE
jgi:hypothetical protein